jgi:hypothetical protein
MPQKNRILRKCNSGAYMKSFRDFPKDLPIILRKEK